MSFTNLSSEFGDRAALNDTDNVALQKFQGLVRYVSEVDAVAVWKKLILQQRKPQVVASVMEYLTDRVYGRPAQTIQRNPRQQLPVS